MKKVVKLLIISLLAFAAAFSLFACDGTNGKTEEKGIIIRKMSGDSFYTVTDYNAKDGETTLDIAQAAQDKYGENGAKTIVIGRIRAGAFDGNDNLTEIIVKDQAENGTLTIDAGAFKNMRALTKITLPFVGANAYSDAYYNETEPAKADELKATDKERLFGYIFGEDEDVSGYAAAITQSYGDKSDMTATFYIPATLREVAISATNEINIPMYAFCGISGITTVNLNGNIKAIGVAAFKNAIGLKKINIPASVKFIYDSAFEGAESIKTFGENGFTIDANSTLTEIRESAFKGTKLTSFDISGTQVKEIGNYAFYGSALTTFTFSAQIETIGAYAFANSAKLEVVKPACADATAFFGTLSE